jgi:transposase
MADCGGYPSDVTDEEWVFVLPYLLLCREDSPQRKYDLRTVFNAVRYVRERAVSGVFCRAIFRPGTWCISRCSVGLRRIVSNCWWEMCARCCASGAVVRASQRRLWSTAARCNRRSSPVRGRATTGPSAGRDRRYISWSIRSDICSPWPSRPPIRAIASRYVQVVEENVMRAVNSHASTVLEGWTPAVESMGLTGRNVKRLPKPFSGSESNLVKFGEV